MPMKKSDLIPLATNSFFKDNDGELVNVTDYRTVESEISRLALSGCGEAAQRLENSCEDGNDDGSGYVEVDPTNVVMVKNGKTESAVAFVKNTLDKIENPN